jgi:hypothetical protein
MPPHAHTSPDGFPGMAQKVAFLTRPQTYLTQPQHVESSKPICLYKH